MRDLCILCFYFFTSSPVPQQPFETRFMELRIPKKQTTAKIAQIIIVDICIPPDVTLKNNKDDAGNASLQSISGIIILFSGSKRNLRY